MRTFNCLTRLSRCENDFLVKGGTVYNSLFHSFVLIRDHGSSIDVVPTRQRRVKHVNWNISRGKGSFKCCSHNNQSLHIALMKFISSLVTISQQRKILLCEQYFILNALNCGREKGTIRLFFPPLLFTPIQNDPTWSGFFLYLPWYVIHLNCTNRAGSLPSLVLDDKQFIEQNRDQYNSNELTFRCHACVIFIYNNRNEAIEAKSVFLVPRARKIMISTKSYSSRL